jgi:large subunit ribosomal protein L33
MATKKKKRAKIVCTVCKKSSYFTNKTKAVEEKLEMSKFCSFCRKHTIHKEVKR